MFLYILIHYLDNKVLYIIDAQCSHEEDWSLLVMYSPPYILLFIFPFKILSVALNKFIPFTADIRDSSLESDITAWLVGKWY